MYVRRASSLSKERVIASKDNNSFLLDQNPVFLYNPNINMGAPEGWFPRVQIPPNTGPVTSVLHENARVTQPITA